MTNGTHKRAWMPLVALLMATALGLAACGGGGDDGGEDPAATEEDSPADDAAAGGEVEVAATEFAFSLAETLPAGETTFTLVNNGEEEHEFQLVPLKPDAPAVDELIKLPEKEVEKYFLGPPDGIKPIKPGETSDPFNATLESGSRYAYVCFVVSKEEKKPHAFLGMYGEFTVE